MSLYQARCRLSAGLEHPVRGAMLASYAIDSHGVVHDAAIEYDDGWQRFEIGDVVACPPAGTTVWAAGLPIEMHCHSIGGVDFSDYWSIDLDALEQAAAGEGVWCVPTLYLPRSRLNAFLKFMRRYREARDAQRIPHVIGIALEGPLLGSFGGTPEQGAWSPSHAEWERISACGVLGLQYVVLSPDADAPTSHLADAKPDTEWIVALLVASGIRPAFGHFTPGDPDR